MRDLFVILTVLSTVPMIFMRPYVGILAWCWVSYMNPHRLAWGFAYSFPVAMVVGGATLAAWMLSKEPKKLHINAVSGLLIAFVVWMSFANLFAVIPSFAFVKWEQSFKILLMTIVTMVLMQSRERIYALVWVIFASIGFFGIKGGLFTAMTGGLHRVWGPPGTFIEDNNALAMALIMILPLMWFLYQHVASKFLRIGLLGGFVSIAFSIIGSQSRGAFLGAAVMIVFLIWKMQRRVLVGSVILAFLIVGAFFVPQSWIERMQTIETYEQDASAMSRIEVWGFALKLAMDRPITGGGFRAFADEGLYRQYVADPITGHTRNYHSVYFEILAELGFVGLGIFLSLMAAAWFAGSWTIANTRNHPDLQWANDLARATQVSLVGYATAGAFQNLAFFDLYYHLVAILFLTKMVVAKTLEGSAPQLQGEGRFRFSMPAVPRVSKGAGGGVRRSPLTERHGGS